MPRFPSFDGTVLAYTDEGEGPPVVLLHGFASSSFINWVRPGLVDRLVGAGRRAVALDLRGHGASDKPHDPRAYAEGAMARDVQALLDHLGLERCDVVGYSMGAGIALHLLPREPRIRSAVLGGLGSRVYDWQARDPEVIARALLAPDKASIQSPVARSFRDFADATRADRKALAAVQRGHRLTLPGPGEVRVPVLVLCGDNDPMIGSPEELARRIPGARVAVVGGTHLSAVNNPAFHQAVLDFLASQDR